MTPQEAEGGQGSLHVTAAPHTATEVVLRLVIEVQSQSGAPAGPGAAVPATAPRPDPFHSASASEKKDVTFAWTADAVARVRAAYRRLRRTRPGLSQSGLLGAALEVALDDPNSWLGSVCDDLRRTRPGLKRRQVSVQLPLDTVRRFDDLWDRLDEISEDVWGDGFKLTKAHLALAGIEHALKSAEDWCTGALGDRQTGAVAGSDPWSAGGDAQRTRRRGRAPR